ncbi:MAG: hypothetical protein WBD50_08595 [Candidatus Rhabdochlamydia sp.]
MLSLSKKFFNETNYLSEGYKTAFNPTKNKLTFYKADKHLTGLEQITKHVNELQKPIFSEITAYRNCHKKIKMINESIDAKKATLIDLESFDENFKPTSAELKEQIWAVHATNVLPKDILTPKILNLNQEIRSGISNTVHFSLGELVRPHSDMSWEDRPFAIITPLNSIIDQVVNIFAHDTFITGNWRLKKETIVLLPEGTDTSEIRDKCFRTVTYKDPEKSLRIAIDEIIQEKKGLIFRMPKGSVNLGSEALLDEAININTPSFFDALLKEKQGMVSFGDHTHSQIGDASLLGLIRQLSIQLIDITSSPELKISQKPSIYINYHLVKSFYNKIKDKYFTKEEQQNIEKLLSTQEKEIPNRQDIEDPLWPYLDPDYFHSMNQIEMHEFKANHPDLFDGQENEFEASWAISRWFSIGYKQGLQEGLKEIIDKEIQKFLKNPNSSFSLFINNLLNFDFSITSVFMKSVSSSFKKHSNTFSDRLIIVNENKSILMLALVVNLVDLKAIDLVIDWFDL